MECRLPRKQPVCHRIVPGDHVKETEVAINLDILRERNTK